MERLTQITVPADTLTKLLAAVSLLPRGRCCNCGSTEALTVVPMSLPVADLVQESDVTLPLPHCQRCLPTAGRLPPRLGRTLRLFPLFFFLSVALVGGLMQLCGLEFKDYPATSLLGMTLTAIVAPVWLFRRRAPRFSEQTSRYQAVRVKPKKSFLGKVVALELSFTHAGYARLYRDALAAGAE